MTLRPMHHGVPVVGCDPGLNYNLVLTKYDPAGVNHLKITLDGVTMYDADFKTTTSFGASTTNSQQHVWVTTVTAWDHINEYTRRDVQPICETATTSTTLEISTSAPVVTSTSTTSSTVESSSTTSSSVPSSSSTSIGSVTSTVPCQEDQPCFDCHTMGNKICATPVVNQPRSLPQTCLMAASCGTDALVVPAVGHNVPMPVIGGVASVGLVATIFLTRWRRAR